MILFLGAGGNFYAVVFGRLGTLAGFSISSNNGSKESPSKAEEARPDGDGRRGNVHGGRRVLHMPERLQHLPEPPRPAWP